VVVTKAPTTASTEESGTASIKLDIGGADDDDHNLVCFCKTPSGKQAYGLLTNNKDGTFTVDINASEPGMHVIDILNDGKKVPGAPFLVNIIQAVDKKKVLFYGKGLQGGLLSEFHGVFQVDTTGAGPGDLNVRVNGPKKAFHVEMTRGAVSRGRVVDVNYTPTVAGLYTVDILWSGDHVEGSPVEVQLLEAH